jgi:hypothetical protein
MNDRDLGSAGMETERRRDVWVPKIKEITRRERSFGKNNGSFLLFNTHSFLKQIQSLLFLRVP